ncbi:antitoxin MazE family protein [bacterium]|nr:antitoxin MazE family protein [bacterium]
MVARSSRERAREFRARKRREGMRLLQIWVPDAHSPEFAAEAHRQSVLAARADARTDDQDFIDSIAEEDGW